MTDPVQPTPWYQSRTIITAVAMAVLSVLEYSGVKVGDFPLDKVIDGILAIGMIYITYLRLEPSPPKPLTQAQSDQLTKTAKKITGG